MNYNFWTIWKNQTDIEQNAIASVIKARDIVIKAIPKSELVAIYIKGSFARRELMANSDVDMVPIVSKNEFEGPIFAVNGPVIDPVMAIPLSLEEFKTNKLHTKGSFSPDLRAEPDLFLNKLDNYKLIYGNPLDISKYPIRSDNEILISEITKIKDGYIPAYEQGIIKFQPLIKEVFWLTELEQNIKGKHPTHSFKGILNSTEKPHIIYEAYALLTNPDRSKEKQFIIKLKEHLNQLNNS